VSLRARLTLLTALAVGVTAVAVSAIAYFLVDDRLRGDLDESLRGEVVRIADLPAPPELALGFVESPVPGPRRYYAVVLPDGRVEEPPNQEPPIRVPEDGLVAARAADGVVVTDGTLDGESFRFALAPSSEEKVVVIARSLAEIEATMNDLRTALLLLSAVAVLFSAGVALLIGRAVIRPVSRLTRAAEDVAATQDLSASIDVRRHDELGRLASSINAMLAALDASRDQQRRLVSDAEHELRTPLTSVRTNVEVLARQPDMPAAERRRVLAALTGQVEELTQLMDDLVELARDQGARTESMEDVQLDEVVMDAVERVRPRAGDVALEVLELEPSTVRGQRRHLERAVVNVLDNACKWSPPGSQVEVRVGDGRVTIRDHGVGIDPADLPYVFDRFYRAPSARSAPGSGLGLAIVRRVVDQHSGSIHLDHAEGGGSVATMTLPTLERAANAQRRIS